jgi:hypothetical protein
VSVVPIQIATRLPDADSTGPWWSGIQQHLPLLRTDLDAFSPLEIACLAHHGFRVAAHAHQDMRKLDAPKLDGASQRTIEDGRHIDRRVFSARDPASLALAALALCGLAVVSLPAVALFHFWEGRRDAWATASAVELDEPSGIVPLGEVAPWTSFDRWRPPLLVAVDDDEADLFVLRVLDESLGKYGVLERLNLGFNRSRLNDLEAVTYDPTARRYWAVTSHRSGRGDQKRQRHLLEFSFDWYSGNPRPVVQSDVDLGEALVKRLKASSGLDDELWSNAEPSRYALEVEGLAARDGRLTIGLNWPLWGDDAIVLEYDTRERSLGSARRLPLKHGETAHGVSALVWHGQDLWVAANPPDKGRRDSINHASWLFVCRGSGVLERADVREPNTRLEGLAITGDRLVVAYEGRRPLIGKRRIADIKLESHGRCDGVHAR